MLLLDLQAYGKNISKMKLVIFLLILAIIFFVSFKQLELITNRYSTYSKLVESGDLSLGWITNIPKSSTNIVEYHNIDTNEVWISFIYSNIDTFLTECKKVDKIKARFWPNSYPNIKWKSIFQNDLNQKLKFKCKESLIVVKYLEDYSHVMVYRYSK